MADKRRSMALNFWRDSYIQELNPNEKLLFSYLVLNPGSNMAGIFECTEKTISNETDIDKQTVKDTLEKFKADGKIIRIGNYIVLVNFIKHQNYNLNMIKAMLKEFKNIPMEVLHAFLENQKCYEILKMLLADYVAFRSLYEADFEQLEAMLRDGLKAPKKTKKAKAENTPTDRPTDEAEENQLVSDMRSDGAKDYAKKAFDIFKNHGLPCCNENFITFLQTDFKNGLEYLKPMKIHSDDVLSACENYAESCSSSNTWLGKWNFERFVRSKAFSGFLPSNYIKDNYIKTDRPTETQKDDFDSLFQG